MSAAQFTGGSVSNGTLYGRGGGSNRNTERLNSNSVWVSDRKSIGRVGLVRGYDLKFKQRRNSLRPLIIRRRNIPFCAASSSEAEERVALQEDGIAGNDSPESEESGNGRSNQRPDVKREILMLSLPAAAGQALDPLAQLLETAYIGRLGALELGSAGVSVNIFNYISKLFNIPLLSVATSFVAEDISKNEVELSASENSGAGNGTHLVGAAKRMQLPSVSTALLLSVGIGVFEALALSLGSGVFLSLMGISIDSPMRVPAKHYLSLRALGAPAVVVSLALQGVFRGFKDTKTPVLCLGIGNLLAVFLFPLLMHTFRLGVTGAALSTVISQYVVTILMLWFLNKRAILLPPKMESLQFGGYAKSGGFLLGRTLAVLSTMTLGTSMAAREGPVAMAAHQICIQVWLAVSLLVDAMGAAAQALTASYLSKGDYKSVKEIAYYSIKLSLFTGILLTVILSLSFGSLATLFTKDPGVLKIVGTGVLFVSASQPLNALAYVFDGLHYGVSDFAYVAWAMMVVGAISSVVLVYGSRTMGLPGVWLGLTVFMGLRTVAGFYRLLSRNGPWWFLHSDYRKVELAN